MSRKEQATKRMEQWASDSGTGYDQQYRWGERGDYDCSSAVITAWEQSGVKVRSAGASYTGNMRGVFLRNGFSDVTDRVSLETGGGLVRGDVLLNNLHHTAMYCGEGKTVEASINELGTVTGGAPGDQTGREFLVRSYRNYPWDCVLRYTAEDGDTVEAPDSADRSGTVQPQTTRCCAVTVPEVYYGESSESVRAMQALLNLRLGILLTKDGEYGTLTGSALKAYQRQSGLNADGICGVKTWQSLLREK